VKLWRMGLFSSLLLDSLFIPIPLILISPHHQDRKKSISISREEGRGGILEGRNEQWMEWNGMKRGIWGSVVRWGCWYALVVVWWLMLRFHVKNTRPFLWPRHGLEKEVNKQWENNGEEALFVC
jgi:hypothetical protein